MQNSSETHGYFPYFIQCWTEAITKRELVRDENLLTCGSWEGRGWGLYGTVICAIAIPFTPVIYGVAGTALYIGPSPDNKPKPLKDSKILAILDVLALVITSPLMMAIRTIRCLFAAIFHPKLLLCYPEKPPQTQTSQQPNPLPAAATDKTTPAPPAPAPAASSTPPVPAAATGQAPPPSLPPHLAPATPAAAPTTENANASKDSKAAAAAKEKS